MPALQRFADRWRSRGLAVITVAVADNAARSRNFLSDNSLVLPLVHDPEQAIARAWGVRMLPSALVLDRRHRLVAHGSGALDWDAARVDLQLQTLLK